MAVTDIGTLITSSPEIRGDRPRIAGTGVTVQTIATRYKLGMTAEDIAEDIPHLELAQVYGALAYYHANREEIDRRIQEDDAAARQIEAEWLRERDSAQSRTQTA